MMVFNMYLFQIYGYVGYLYMNFRGVRHLFPWVSWWFILQADRLRGRDFSEAVGLAMSRSELLGGDQEIQEIGFPLVSPKAGEKTLISGGGGVR